MKQYHSTTQQTNEAIHGRHFNRSGWRASPLLRRPDVRRLVSALIESAPGNSDDSDRWWHYETAKAAISDACGWTAPQAMYDQNIYDVAVRDYIEGSGL